MATFFTSDLHFGHANVAAYCGRPYIRETELTEPYSGQGRPKWHSAETAMAVAGRMSTALIRNINSRCREGDKLVHVGDFCVYGRANGVDGMRRKAEDWEAEINCTVIHILGNHDRANKVRGFAPKAVLLRLGKRWMWIQHLPPWHDHAWEAPPDIDGYICGHIHDKWKLRWYNDLPVVNVSCDVWNYHPITSSELIGYIEHVLHNKCKEAENEQEAGFTEAFF